jgi:hypothetical protein
VQQDPAGEEQPVRPVLSYVVGAPTEGIARAKAVEMARQHYVEYDSFTPYHTEKLK